MFACFLAVPLLGTMLSDSYLEENIRVFENPEKVSNTIYYVILILLFTGFILLLIKFNAEKILKAVILVLIVISIQYVLLPFLPSLIAFGMAIGLTLILYFKPTWYIIDALGLLLAIGITAVFGISLSPVPAVILLAVLAVYDYLSVYRTKHMVSLAEAVVKLKMPILLVFPFKRDFRLTGDIGEMKSSGAFFLGLGDLIIPSILVVSANTFFSRSEWFLNIHAVSTLLGIIAGFSGLMISTRIKGGAHPGLPFLNAGAILGFGISLLLF